MVLDFKMGGSILIAVFEPGLSPDRWRTTGTRVHLDMQTTGICKVRVRALILFHSAGTFSSLAPTNCTY